MEPITGPLNLNQLRLLLAVVRHGSVTRGAAAVFVSQPSVSKAIQELEREVGVPLLERVGRGVRVTEAGAVLAQHAELLFGIAADAQRAMDEFRGLSRGQLRIGASTTIGNYLAPRLLGAYHARHPAITLALDVGNTAHVLHQMRQLAVDLALVEGPILDAGLIAQPFRIDELIVLSAPDHPFASRSEIAPEDLADVPFLAREPGSGTREVVDAALSARGISLSIAMELGHSEAIKQAVAAGLGVSMLSRLTVERELRDGSLVATPLRGMSIRRSLVLVQRTGARPSSAARAFLDVLGAESGPSLRTAPQPDETGGTDERME